jgi:hypothetical protein
LQILDWVAHYVNCFTLMSQRCFRMTWLGPHRMEE